MKRLIAGSLLAAVMALFAPANTQAQQPGPEVAPGLICFWYELPPPEPPVLICLWDWIP